MNDGMEGELVGHENTSSPEPYFCRPMALDEIVDAVTCPSGLFRSAKGLLDRTQPPSYYPPRADLFDFGGTPCLPRIGYPGSCDPGDSAQYFALDDVDAVATATPPYGAPYVGRWIVPADLAARRLCARGRGGERVRHERRPRPPQRGERYGHAVLQQRRPARECRSAVGSISGPVQPGNHGRGASARDIVGYGDWTGATGDVTAPDGTMSSAPGSGVGRLPLFDSDANGQARVSVTLGACASVDCASTPSPLPLPVSFTATATAASAGSEPRSRCCSPARTAASRSSATTCATRAFPTPPPSIRLRSPPGRRRGLAAGTPGTSTTAQINGLTPETIYGAGISARGVCGSSPPTFQVFSTPATLTPSSPAASSRPRPSAPTSRRRWRPYEPSATPPPPAARWQRRRSISTTARRLHWPRPWPAPPSAARWSARRCARLPAGSRSVAGSAPLRSVPVAGGGPGAPRPAHLKGWNRRAEQQSRPPQLRPRSSPAPPARAFHLVSATLRPGATARSKAGGSGSRGWFRGPRVVQGAASGSGGPRAVLGQGAAGRWFAGAERAVSRTEWSAALRQRGGRVLGRPELRQAALLFRLPIPTF